MDHARLIDPFPPEDFITIRIKRVAQLCFQSVVSYAAKCQFDFASDLLQITLESLECHSGEFSAGFKISERAVSNHIVLQAFERGDGMPSKNSIINRSYFSG